MHYLLFKLKVRDVMTKRVITVDDDCPLEEAARIMVDHRVGCLPILKEGRLAGIITETDIFRTFVEILGGREKGLRLTLDVTEGKGVLAAIANEILRNNGNILSLATFFCKDETERIITVKVTEAPKEAPPGRAQCRRRQGPQHHRHAHRWVHCQDDRRKDETADKGIDEPADPRPSENRGAQLHPFGADHRGDRRPGGGDPGNSRP